MLEHVSLEVGPHARIGLVGPNGVGKSTVLRLLAGEEVPDTGIVAIDPPRATVAYLPQEPEQLPGETLRRRLARLTGVAAAERALEEAAAALASEVREPQSSSDRYDGALARFLALGGGDFDARAAATCARLGLGVDLDRPFEGLSGGEAARASLAAVLLARADLLLLDGPRTTWTRTGSHSSRRSSSGSRARSSWCRTTASSSTGPCSGSPRSNLARMRSSSGPGGGRTTRGAATRRGVPRTSTSPARSSVAAS